MLKPLTLTPEKEAQLREEAEGLYQSIGWGVPYTPCTKEELEWFWNELVYKELGYDSCETCGYWSDRGSFYDGKFGQVCDMCWQDEEDEEDE